MDRATLVNLFNRKLAGESVKALATEAGLPNMQALQGAWRKAGLSGAAMSEKTEHENAPEDTSKVEPVAVNPTEGVVEELKPEPEAKPDEKLMGMLDDLLCRPLTGTEETPPAPTGPEASVVEKPKPVTKKATRTFDPAKVAEAVEAKRADKKWSEVAKLLGDDVSWNAAWGAVNAVAPELCGKSK